MGMNVLSTTASIIGMILGTAGFVISVLVYLRDRAKVKVSLQWEMRNLQTGEARGLIRITNIGRRPVFISIVAIALPPGFEHAYLVMQDSIAGKKLDEGEKPLGVFVPYERLAQYSRVWRKMRACAEDSTGKRYHSAYPAKDAKTPPWVTP